MGNKTFLFGLILFLGALTGIVMFSLNAQAAVTIVGPANYSWSGNLAASQKFTFSFDNATGIDANCTLNMDQTGGLVNQYGVVNQTSNDLTLLKFAFSNMTAINLTVNNANSSGYVSGRYYWNVSCINNSETAGGVVTTRSLTRWFLSDRTAPTGNISTPSNKSFRNTALISINGTINDSYSGPNFDTIKLQFSNSSGGCWQWPNSTWGSCNLDPNGPGSLPGDLTIISDRTLRVNSSNFNVSYSFGRNITNITLSDDEYNFVIHGGDTVAQGLGDPNWGVINVSFVYDTTPPAAEIYTVNLLSNNSWINSRVIRTNLTVTDRATDHFNLSLFDSASAIVNSTNITLGNATASLFNVTLTADGTYTVNLTAVDNATNKNSTVLLFYIRVDATVPNSTIFSVSGSANNSWFNTRILIINVTAADANINHFNVTINATNSTNISTGGVYDTAYNLSVGSDGTYLVGLTTVDNATNLNSSPSFYVRVDATVPNATLFNVNSVTNNSWFNTRVLRVNVSALDLNIKYFNVTINATNSTNITTGGVTETLYNLSVGSDGTYTINLTVADNATNSNSSAAFYVRVDATVPNSTIFSVSGSANNSWFTSRALRINITAADVNINHFNVTINATNSSNISIGGVYDTLYNLSVGSDGTYLVGLTTMDNATNLNVSPSFYARVDATVPNSTVFSVNGLANTSWVNTRIWSINVTAADVNINHFNVTINATNSTNISTGGVYNTVYNLSVSGSEGIYRINLATVDNATNTNSSPNFYLGLDLTTPNSSINNISGKVNNSWVNNRMLAINFTARDTNTKNWSIYVYNTTDIFNSSPSGWNYTYYESNTSAEVNFSAPRDGTYFFNLTTNDNATNANTTAALFYIRVDATNPSIGTPSFSGISSSGASLSVEMGESNLNSCTYSGGSSGTLTCSGGTCTASLSGLSASIIYSYSVSCTDLAGNSATGASNSFMTSSASSGSGSGGSGGGSSSGVAGQFTKTVWSSLYAGETATIKVKEGDGIGITEVSFKVDKTAYGVIGDVKKADKTEVPAEIGGKKVHNYMKITVTGAIKEENTQERTVLFKVAKKWLEDNAVSKDKLALYRYADSKWNALTTKITQEDETTVYYSAETPGFSYFAIAESDVAAEALAPVKEEVPVEEAPAEEAPEALAEEAPAEEEAAAPEEAKSNVWLWVIVVVVIAGIIAGIYFWPKKKKRGF